jgi:hypothetical protein
MDSLVAQKEIALAFIFFGRSIFQFLNLYALLIFQSYHVVKFKLFTIQFNLFGHVSFAFQSNKYSAINQSSSAFNVDNNQKLTFSSSIDHVQESILLISTLSKSSSQTLLISTLLSAQSINNSLFTSLSGIVSGRFSSSSKDQLKSILFNLISSPSFKCIPLLSFNSSSTLFISISDSLTFQSGVKY